MARFSFSHKELISIRIKTHRVFREGPDKFICPLSTDRMPAECPEMPLYFPDQIQPDVKIFM